MKCIDCSKNQRYIRVFSGICHEIISKNGKICSLKQQTWNTWWIYERISVIWHGINFVNFLRFHLPNSLKNHFYSVHRCAQREEAQLDRIRPDPTESDLWNLLEFVEWVPSKIPSSNWAIKSDQIGTHCWHTTAPNPTAHNQKYRGWSPIITEKFKCSFSSGASWSIQEHSKMVACYGLLKAWAGVSEFFYLFLSKISWFLFWIRLNRKQFGRKASERMTYDLYFAVFLIETFQFVSFCPISFQKHEGARRSHKYYEVL